MKTYNKIKNVSLLFLTVSLVTACTKDFKELNTNPALLSEDLVSANYLLSGVQAGLGGGLSASDADNYAGMTVSVSNSPFTDRFDDRAWTLTYTSFCNNLAAIVRKTKDKPELVNKNAIARIMKAWIYSQATDVYGDIPYFDANKPPEESVTSPKYDLQKDIYQDLFKELKEAAASLDPSQASYGNADFYYGGNVTKWKKFANSIRLRLALRVRYVDAEMAKANVSDLQDSDFIIARSDDAVIFTADDIEGHRGYLYNQIANLGDKPARQDFVDHQLVGKALLDALVGNSPPTNPLDPRTKVIADTAVLNGATLPTPHEPFGFRAQPLLGNVPVENKYPYGSGSTSLFSLFWYAPIIEQPILRSSEVYFALAEAALFNLRSGDPNTYFKKGIEASIVETQSLYNKGKDQMPGVLALLKDPGFDVDGYLAYKEMKQSEIDAFLASSATTLVGSTEEKLEQIMNQKLIALYPSALEGWSEWRRTGYPRVLVANNEQSTFHGVSPRRQHYPSNEGLINSVNVKQAIDRMGGTDDMLKRVWWDANAAAPHKHPGTVEWRAAPWK